MVTLFAPAKINMALKITGRRHDGYHLLDSVVMFADVGDEIEISAAPADALQISGPFAPLLNGVDPSENIIMQALMLLRQHDVQIPQLAVHLYKNLPIGAGIGGGSADAAAILRYCLKTYPHDLTESDIQAIALNLGADVPVCLASIAHQMSGIGDVLRPLETADEMHGILINPKISLATPTVFNGYKSLNQHFSAPLPPSPTASMHADWIGQNCLTPAACQICPPVASILNALKVEPSASKFGMSGSGSTCFALCDTKNDANTLADKILSIFPSYWAKACSFS